MGGNETRVVSAVPLAACVLAGGEAQARRPLALHRSMANRPSIIALLFLVMRVVWPCGCDEAASAATRQRTPRLPGGRRGAGAGRPPPCDANDAAVGASRWFGVSMDRSTWIEAAPPQQPRLSQEKQAKRSSAFELLARRSADGPPSCACHSHLHLACGPPSPPRSRPSRDPAPDAVASGRPQPTPTCVEREWKALERGARPDRSGRLLPAVAVGGSGTNWMMGWDGGPRPRSHVGA